jgi:hypothetical protein
MANIGEMPQIGKLQILAIEAETKRILGHAM